VTRLGGWVELAEPAMGDCRIGPATERLQQMSQEMAGSLGLDAGEVIFRSVDRYLREAGLEEVTRRELELPVGGVGWPDRSFLASNGRGRNHPYLRGAAGQRRPLRGGIGR